jgi:hypothetical protein
MGNVSICSIIGWFPKHINMEIIQQVTSYITFTGSSIVKKCPTIMCPITNVFRCIGLHTMMCTKQLVFMTKNLREWGSMSKMSLNHTSSFAGPWLLTMGYVCLLMNHTSNMSSVAMNTCPTPHLCPQFTFTWWE